MTHDVWAVAAPAAAVVTDAVATVTRVVDAPSTKRLTIHTAILEMTLFIV
jgi:hypothetical protein